jgi:hypothetical protein
MADAIQFLWTNFDSSENKNKVPFSKENIDFYLFKTFARGVAPQKAEQGGGHPAWNRSWGGEVVEAVRDTAVVRGAHQEMVLKVEPSADEFKVRLIQRNVLVSIYIQLLAKPFTFINFPITWKPAWSHFPVCSVAKGFASLDHICHLNHGKETDLIENGLNTVRFLLLRDRDNRTKVCAKYLSALPFNLDMAMAHYKVKEEMAGCWHRRQVHGPGDQHLNQELGGGPAGAVQGEQAADAGKWIEILMARVNECA